MHPRHEDVQAIGLNLAARTHGHASNRTGCAPSRSFERARSHLPVDSPPYRTWVGKEYAACLRTRRTG
jgi:hypothetical protein